MALEIDDINLGGTLSATTISATTIVFGGQPIQNVFVQNVSGGYLPISGGTVTGETIFNGGLSGSSISATTYYGDGSNLTGIGAGSSTYVQPGSNITTGGTGNSPIVSVVASPSFNSITVSGDSSFITLSATTIISGSTNLYDIFSTGGPGVESTYVQPGSNIITGGTATNPTINLIDSPSINNITFSGTAIGGTVQAGVATFTSLSSGTVSGGTIYSGGTNLYSIFATIPDQNDVTRVQPGSNITTGGTATSPIISLVASPSVNNLTISGLTSSSDGATFSSLSGTNIFSGNTNLQTYFNLDRAQINTKADISGETFTGQVNVPTLSATTFSASNATILSSFNFPVSPVAGYVMTSDASGNITLSGPASIGTGSTKVDMQAITTATTTTATSSLVDVPGMVLTAKNLGTSATTYIINFAGTFSNSSNSGAATIRATLNGVQIPGSPTMTFTNAGAAMASTHRNVSLVCKATGVSFGDVIKIQMSASTGTLTAQAGKTLSIIGVLTNNLV